MMRQSSRCELQNELSGYLAALLRMSASRAHIFPFSSWSVLSFSQSPQFDSTITLRKHRLQHLMSDKRTEGDWLKRSTDQELNGRLIAPMQTYEQRWPSIRQFHSATRSGEDWPHHCSDSEAEKLFAGSSKTRYAECRSCLYLGIAEEGLGTHGKRGPHMRSRIVRSSFGPEQPAADCRVCAHKEI